MSKINNTKVSALDDQLELAIAREKISRLTLEKERLAERIRTLTHEPSINQLKGRLNTKENEISDLNARLSERNTTIAELEKILTEHNSAIEELQKIASENAQTSTELANLLSEREKTVAELEEIIKDKNEYTQKLETYLSKHDKNTTEMAKILAEKESFTREFEESLAEKNFLIKTLEDSIKEKENVLHDLRDQYQQSMDETDACMQRASALESRLNAVLGSLTWKMARMVLGRIEKVGSLFNLLNKSAEAIVSPSRKKTAQQTECGPSEHQQCQISPKDEKTLLRGDFSRDHTLVISSHDASRTGAPLIILNIAQKLVQEKGVKCLFLFVRGGDLLDDFKELGDIRVLEDWQKHPANAGISLDDLVGCMLAGHNPSFALLNSSESHPLYSGLRKAGVHFIGLIHEFADPYPKHIFKKIVDLADEIVFPSQIVYDAAVKKLGKDPGNISICPQGLFDPSFPKGDKKEGRKKVLKELGLEDDAFIVLGCGYVDARKGCDIFAATAYQLRKKRPDADIVFVWLGNTGTSVNINGADFQYWLQKDIETKQAEEYIRFVGEREDVTPWFHAADCFYMASRQDPFPCVVLEAMAARMPVICFENATGSVDAIEDDAGFTVPYLDAKSACEKIEHLYDNPDVCKKIGEAGRNKALTKYDYDAYVEKIVDKISHYSPSTIAGKRAKLAPEECRRVIIPCSDWGLSGVNTLLEVFGEEFYKHNWDFRILFTSTENHVSESAKGNLPKNIKYDFLGAASAHDQHSKWQGLIDYFEREAPCIMLTGYDYMANAIAPALTDNVGIVGWNHADDLEYYEQVHRLGRYWNKMICVSQEIADNILRMNPAFEKELHVIPNGAIRKVELEKKKRPVGEKLKLLYAGRLVQYQKRVRDFAEIIKEMDKTGIPYEFTFAGEDHDGSGAFLKESLAEHIKDGRVKMPGRLNRSEVLQAFSDSDIFVLISDFEGMPVSLVEAMAKGCVPVLAEIESGIDELVDETNGIIIRGRDYAKWAKLLADLYKNKKQLMKLSKAAVATIEKKYTVEQVGDKFDAIFSEVMTSIVSGTYKRPQTMKWMSKTGDVLPPQNY